MPSGECRCSRTAGLTRVGVFVQLSGGLAGPDGLALDAEGNLAVAHAGLGVVWIVSRLGEPSTGSIPVAAS